MCYHQLYLIKVILDLSEIKYIFFDSPYKKSYFLDFQMPLSDISTLFLSFFDCFISDQSFSICLNQNDSNKSVFLDENHHLSNFQNQNLIYSKKYILLENSVRFEIQSMAQQLKPQQVMSNLRVSTEVINLHPQTQTGELIITNTHQKYSLLFKIKTKIEKVLEVRPSRGLLKAGQKAVISFKPITKISEADRSKYEKTLQFLLQAVNLSKQQITKEEEEALWKAIKQKKADITLGYSAVKIGINMSGSAEQREFVAPLSNYQSRIDSKFASHVKSEKSASTLNDLNQLRPEPKDARSDTELSQRYAELKSQHENLQRQRAALLSVKGRGGSGGGSSTVTLLLIFVVFFLVGNYLRGVMEPPPKPQVEEQGWFWGLLS